MKKYRNPFLLGLVFSLGMFTFNKLENPIISYFNPINYVCWSYTLPEKINGSSLSVSVCDFNADNNPDLLECYIKQPDGINKKLMTCSNSNNKPLTIEDCSPTKYLEDYFNQDILKEKKDRLSI